MQYTPKQADCWFVEKIQANGINSEIVPMLVWGENNRKWNMPPNNHNVALRKTKSK